MLYPWHHVNYLEAKMIKLKLNVDLLKHKAGTIISVDSDNEGNIKDSFWARRLKDSVIDGCVELVKEPTLVKPHKKREDQS